MLKLQTLTKSCPQKKSYFGGVITFSYISQISQSPSRDDCLDEDTCDREDHHHDDHHVGLHVALSELQHVRAGERSNSISQTSANVEHIRTKKCKYDCPHGKFRKWETSFGNYVNNRVKVTSACLGM